VLTRPLASPCSSAELERRAHEAAGQSLLLRRNPVRGRDVERAVGQRKAEAGKDERREHGCRVARVEANRQEEQVADRGRREARGDQPP
jgi:hypothetical protein